MRANCYHVLKQNDNLNMQRHFVFFDTETRQEINGEYRELSLKLGWAVYWDSVTDARQEHSFSDYADFWAWVDALPVKDLMMFAHNTGFDMKVTDGYRQLLGIRGYAIKSFYVKESVYKIEVCKNVKPDIGNPYMKTIRIYDTMNFVGMSLEKLGKSIGLPKMKIKDFDKVTVAELSVYCLNDVLIIERFIKGLVKFLIENNLSKLTSTGASLAFNIYRHRFYDPQKTPFCIHANKGAIALERASYHGGITDCFSTGHIKGDLLKVDVNSMYPWAMQKYDVPTRLILFRKDADCMSLMRYHLDAYMEGRRHYLGVAECIIELPQDGAYILTRYKKGKDSKCGFVKGRFKASLTWPELAFVKEHGKIISCSKLALYEHHIMFKEYVDFFYDVRLNAKGNNPAQDLFGKLCLNKLYGKYAQRQCMFEKARFCPRCQEMHTGMKECPTCDGPLKESFKEAYGESIEFSDKGKKRYLMIGRSRIEVGRSEDNSFDSFVAVASYITSYARMRLVGLILKAGRENCHYCDTDSIIIDEKGAARLHDEIDEFELGKLKIEGKADKATIYRPKFYIFGDDFKCKGVRKKAEGDIADFNIPKTGGSIICWDDDHRLIVKQERFEGFGGAMKNGTLGLQRISEVIKEMSKDYNKGHVGYQGRVYSFDASEVVIK